MKLECAAVLLFVTVLCQSAMAADAHCYTFRNDSKGVTTLSFSYNQTIGNVVTSAAIDPGKTYPFDGRPWCWNLPDGYTATVTVAGSGAPQWTGNLVLGNGPSTASSGTYVVADTKPAPAQPEGCLANSFPHNEAYCLTALKTDIHLQCGVGHTGLSGVIVVSHLSLTCHDGRKWNLTCIDRGAFGQQCDLNDQQMCKGENQWPAAGYCPHGGARPKG